MAQISVIVPIYKVEKYIRPCIESILDQSFQDYDLILVDDGSPDACPQICDEYALQDDRIVVIHKQNGGLSDARNAGIDWAMDNSSSKWLAFVDGDDYIHKDFLLNLYNTAKEENADLVICDFARVGEKGDLIDLEPAFSNVLTDSKKQLFEILIKNWHIISACNKLYHKHLFDHLRFAFGKLHEDTFAIHHVLWNCEKAAIIPDILYYYRQRSTSIMATESIKSRLDVFEALLDQYAFVLDHQIIRYPTEYMLSFTSLRKQVRGDEKKRYDELMKAFKKLYFRDPANHSLKRSAAFYFGVFYQKASKLIHKR